MLEFESVTISVLTRKYVRQLMTDKSLNPNVRYDRPKDKALQGASAKDLSS